nr:glycosyltransferase [Nocardioides zeae]
MTRFNLPTGGAEGLVRAREGWLLDRVQMFERYCLPSVRAQRGAAVTWIVYLDPESPDWLRARIGAWVQRSGLVPVFRSTVSAADLAADLAAHVDRRHATLLTTNLDNDDGLAVDAAARLQAAARACPAPRTALYLRHGIVLATPRVHLRSDRRNAFCSVHEPWEGAVTCWADWHNRLQRQMPATVLGGDPGWVQVVHGRNVSNRVRGRLVAPARYAAVLPALADLAPPGRGAVVADRLVAHPLRELRARVRSSVRDALLATTGTAGVERVSAVLARHRRGTRARAAARADLGRGR